MKKRLASVFIYLLMMTFANSVYADSETATLYVNAEAVASVTVTCSALNFPAFDSNSPGEQVQGEGAVSVNASVNYKISLDAGRYFNGNSRCLDSGKQLQYGLYQDAARTIEWGDSDLAGTYMSGTSKSSDAGNKSHTVYGTLKTASVAPGNYQDAVIVTVTY